MYSVAVKIEGIESRRRSAGLLHIVIGFFLFAKGADFYRISGYQGFLPLVPVFLVAAAALFYGFFRRRFDITAKYNTTLRFIEVLTFFSIGFAMLKTARLIDYGGVFIFALLCIILMVSEKKAFTESAIQFTDDGLIIPGYYRDHFIKWPELSEVIIREDFITIFHVRQKYLQYQVKQDLSTLEVAKMNAFCREKIESIQTKPEEVKQE